MRIRSATPPRRGDILRSGRDLIVSSHPLTPDRQKGVNEQLKNLCLPDEVIKILSPPFSRLGYTVIKEDPLKAKMVDDRMITTIKNRKWQCRCAHIPCDVLRDKSEQTVQAVNFLSFYFSRNEKLFIFSQGCDQAHQVYREMLFKQWEDKGGIIWKFIPWMDFAELENLCKAGEAENKIVESVKGIFGVEAHRLSPKDLMEDERERIVKIITEKAVHYGDGPEAYFDKLKMDLQPHLPKGWPNEISSVGRGNPEVNAKKLVDWTIDKGLISDTGQYTLISLLEVVKPLVGLEELQFIERIIADYGLCP